MRPSSLLTPLTFLVLSCGAKKSTKIDQTDTIKTNSSNSKIIDTTNNTTFKLDGISIISDSEILVSSGQTLPYKTVQINNCNFELVTTNNDTTYLSTSDNRFKTPEGYGVGFQFSELSKKIQTALIKEPGWGYYFKLQSGWTLGFCEGNSCTDKYPQNGSTVKWVFKRH